MNVLVVGVLVPSGDMFVVEGRLKEMSKVGTG